MKDKEQKEYDQCMEMIHKLIGKWEKMRPDEELVVMVLPKYDLKKREERMHQIYGMLLREQWEK